MIILSAHAMGDQVAPLPRHIASNANLWVTSVEPYSVVASREGGTRLPNHTLVHTLISFSTRPFLFLRQFPPSRHQLVFRNLVKPGLQLCLTACVPGKSHIVSEVHTPIYRAKLRDAARQAFYRACVVDIVRVIPAPFITGVYGITFLTPIKPHRFCNKFTLQIEH